MSNSSAAGLGVSLFTHPPRPEVGHVAIGMFDGVHRGHQAVIGVLRERAARGGGKTAVLTFEPHPLVIINPARAPKRLTSPEDRGRLLREAGVDEVLLIAFDEATRNCTAAEFTAQLLRIAPNLKTICIGAYWSFGRDRTGNAAYLKEIGAKRGFAVAEVPPVLAQGHPVSSTRIREAIQARQFALAEELLGRPYAVRGRVVEGKKLGQQMGFPTANLAGLVTLLPPSGVYACRVRLDSGEEEKPAVFNIGTRPTVDETGTLSAEAHLLDFDGNLYGRTLTLARFIFLREEQKFAGLAELKAQIQRDVEQARRISGQPN